MCGQIGREMKAIFVVFYFFGCSYQQQSEFMDVWIEQGRVRGYRSEDGRRYSFTGIPYATVPTGLDRYKAPLPPPKWNGTSNATEIIKCAQSNNEQYVGTEDCLFANIFIPAYDHNSNLPVLVLVHGGAYLYGTGHIVTGNRMLDEGVIVVSFNYRLGLLGLLCLGTETVPGNAALKDQVAALRWIKSNIANFGGDPHRMTIYGSSAGGSYVDLLVLSKATDGLFEKAIIESGSALAGWSVSYDPIAAAQLFASVLGYGEENQIEELERIYTNASAEELSLAIEKIYLNNIPPLYAAPCVEKYLDNHTVLTDTPMNILQSADYTMVPLMIAFSSNEGLFFARFWERGWNVSFLENPAKIWYPDLRFKSETEKTEVSDCITSFYMNRSKDELEAFIDTTGDYFYAYPTMRAALMHAANSLSVYLLKFSYHDEAAPGASHSYFRRHVLEEKLPTEQCQLAADRATTIVGNFIKYGNPMPNLGKKPLQETWSPIDSNFVQYLHFGNELSVQHSPQKERFKLWHDLYQQYYNDVPVGSKSVSVHSNVICVLVSVMSAIRLYYIVLCSDCIM